MYIEDRIREIVEKLQLPESVLKTAVKLYIELRSTGKYSPTTLSVLDADAAALVYISCRLNHICVRYYSIVAASNVDLKKVTKRLRRIMKMVNVDYRCGVFNFILKYIELFKMPEETVETALKIAKKVEENKVHLGKDPSSIAAAIIYLTGLLHDIHITQREVASKTGIAEPTVRNRYKEILSKCFDTHLSIFGYPEQIKKIRAKL